MITRRRLLGGLLASAAATALPRVAWADGGPKRLVCVFSPNCFHPDNFLPGSLGAGFSLPPQLTPFAPVASKVSVVGNLMGAGHDHDYGVRACLTGSFGENASVDQVVANAVGGATALKSLELGVRTQNSVAGRVSYAGPGLSIPPITDPRFAFARIAAAANPDPLAAARVESQQGALLAALESGFDEATAPLTSEESSLLVTHRELVSERLFRVNNPVPVGSCDVGVEPQQSPDEPDSWPVLVQQQIDNLVVALRCDITRVASLVLGRSQQNEVMGFLGLTDNCHDIGHGSPASDPIGKKLVLDRFYAEQVAALAIALDAIPEGSGTMLDNTLILWSNELGASGFTHSRAEMAVALIGGAGVVPGRSIDAGGRSYGDLLLTVAHAMDQTHLTTFGTRGTGVLPDVLA